MNFKKDIMEWKWTCLPCYCTNILGQKMFHDEIKSSVSADIQSVKNRKMITFPSNECFRLWPFKWIKVTKYDMTAVYELSPCYVSKISLKRYLKKMPKSIFLLLLLLLSFFCQGKENTNSLAQTSCYLNFKALCS